jgi:hypothetical protein
MTGVNSERVIKSLFKWYLFWCVTYHSTTYFKRANEDPAEGSFEHSSKHMGHIKGREFLDQMSGYQLLKDSAPGSGCNSYFIYRS